ncbi:Helix-turn-helix domain-containing protein [Anaerosphaera aminiphila DSM 21120]|uniref:Helix-turn-helix domain-containing protein n=1 Tax=Anaerosphaera aminiphila DSM 21120 TaxID=1120995 RepID=A0A1M5PV18_9FIRM|nr:helix-turn-helix domain-containing protein [Anaerosphaera aminiphila]SHH05644.1 Helix-turn-helix domain-containing protein [Anaerosphaera aminiphila DSM 21120]
MAKYDLEIKKKFIELMLSDRYSITSASYELGISCSCGSRWWRMYKYHGEKCLDTKPKIYSGEFKLYAVKYVQDNNLSIAHASAIFGIPGTVTLNKWIKKYNDEGESGLLSKSIWNPQKSEMKKDKNNTEYEDFVENKTKEELILENTRLRAEVDYLKKSIALKEGKLNSQIEKKHW